MKNRINITDLIKAIPGPATPAWPDGEPFADGLSHGTMSVELFAPRGQDFQKPHNQDALYVVVAGRGEITEKAESQSIGTGDVLFVPAGEKHQFSRVTPDFLTWVIFWGPKGGE